MKTGSKQSGAGRRGEEASVRGGSRRGQPRSTGRSATSTAERGNFRIKNPDGTASLFQSDDVFHIGGRTIHLGSAALAPGGTITLDPAHRDANFRMGQRQRRSMRGMADAFRRRFDEMGGQPMDEAALRLELDVTLGDGGGDLTTRIGVNRTAIMSTQRWFITDLPIGLVGRCVDVARLYRDVLREYRAVAETPMPQPSVALPRRLVDATEANRPDVVLLLNVLFQAPADVNVYVYSERSDDIALAWRGFVRDPDSAVLAELPEDATADEILEYIAGRAGWMDPTTCFWCERNAMSCRSMMVCQQCRKVSYCSKDCQTNDWKGFHKRECKHLKAGTVTREALDLGHSRLSMLTAEGAQRPTVPMPLADAEDRENIWRGDLLLCYAVGMDGNSPVLTDKTKIFPRGAFIRPREHLDGA